MLPIVEAATLAPAAPPFPYRMRSRISGAIGVDELEDPLIALGLVENRQQVAQIVAMVDEDGS